MSIMERITRRAQCVAESAAELADDAQEGIKTLTLMDALYAITEFAFTYWRLCVLLVLWLVFARGVHAPTAGEPADIYTIIRAAGVVWLGWSAFVVSADTVARFSYATRGGVGDAFLDVVGMLVRLGERALALLLVLATISAAGNTWSTLVDTIASSPKLDTTLVLGAATLWVASRLVPLRRGEFTERAVHCEVRQQISERVETGINFARSAEARDSLSSPPMRGDWKQGGET